jgi:hypothetical protein
MAGSCLLHLNTGANSISNYFYLTEGRCIESRQVTGDQSKLDGHEGFKSAALLPARWETVSRISDRFLLLGTNGG